MLNFFDSFVDAMTSSWKHVIAMVITYAIFTAIGILVFGDPTFGPKLSMSL